MIRKFRPSDEKICCKIISECFDRSVVLNDEAKKYIKNRFTNEGYLTSKSKKYDIFVYVRDKKIVGMGALEKNYINKVYILPSMHGKGIGKKIMLFLEKLAFKKKYKTTIVHAYKNSKGFYAKQGYVFKKMFIYDGPEKIKIPTYEMKKKLEF